MFLVRLLCTSSDCTLRFIAKIESCASDRIMVEDVDFQRSCSLARLWHPHVKVKRFVEVCIVCPVFHFRRP